MNNHDNSAAFAELVCRSAFSFGEGASSPEELVDRAVELGLHALAITDRDGVYGLPRAHKHAAGRLRLICGARITIDGGPGLALLVRDYRGWASLCRLLTRARCGPSDPELDPHEQDPDTPRPLDLTEAVKGRGSVPLTEVLARAEGLEAILVGEWPQDRALAVRDAFGEYASWAVGRRLDGEDGPRLERAAACAAAAGLPLLATGDVLMHDTSRRRLQDVINCIRLRCTLEQAGRLLEPNAARALQSPASMARLFRGYEQALARSTQIADRCRFTLDQLAYRYPREVVPDGQRPIDWLRHLTQVGLAEAFPLGVPPKITDQSEHELRLVEKMDFAPYFLTVYDAVRFARQEGILCQGRGSAANSVICYALGVTSVDPSSFDLLFERFISEERGEPPDIDVDFEHERREEVIQYIYEKYGRHRAAMVCTVISWRRRSAVRELGRVFGLSTDQVDRLAHLTRWHPDDEPEPGSRDGAPEGGPDATPEKPAEGGHHLSEKDVISAGLDPKDPAVRLTLELAEEIESLPRHLSIHVGGFTISDGPLIELVPVEPASMDGRTVLQWDKDDIDIVGFVKVDVLALGMLTAIHKAFDLISHAAALGLPNHSPLPPRLSLTAIPPEDPAVFEMIGRSDTLGVFQIESRAQMSMLPRLKPMTYYDLVVEISLVRPGPIQGGMVHPYLRRRAGEEEVIYAHPKLRPILERTLGIPIFQEQVMAMAVAVGGFTPGQADELRRAMGAFRKRGKLDQMTTVLRRNMESNGIEAQYAAQICKQIEGFGEYGFPESHAASFARLVWISAWLRAYHPAAFAAALINSQPMGFYSARSIVTDAQRHGVEVLPVDVQHSDWDCTLEHGASGKPSKKLPDGRGGPALRLGLRQITGLHELSGHVLTEARRADGPFRDLLDLQRRTGLGRDSLGRLARANALRGLAPGAPSKTPTKAEKSPSSKPAPMQQAEGQDWARRDAMWAVAGLYDLPLFRGLARDDEQTQLPSPSPVEELEADFRSTGLSVERHPLGLVRPALRRRGVMAAAALSDVANGEIVRVAGLVTHRQRPGTAKGMLFMTLEDESGMMNLAVRPDLFEKQRVLVVQNDLLLVRGRVQRQGDAISLLAMRFFALPYAPLIGDTSRNFR